MWKIPWLSSVDIQIRDYIEDMKDLRMEFDRVKNWDNLIGFRVCFLVRLSSTENA